MADQPARLEAATIKAEIGSGIVYRFSNDAASEADIPTLSGAIPNLKNVILRIQNEGADKISFATKIFISTAAGIAGTSNQEIFLVQSAEPGEIYEVWQNVSGTAVDTGKRSISAAAVIEATEAATAAAASAQESADAATMRVARFLEPSATPPIKRDDGQPLELGDRYLNTTDQVEYIYKASGWVANNLDAQELASSTGSSLVGHNAETVDVALNRGGSANEFAWGNIKENISDYSSPGPNIGPNMGTIVRTGFDSAGVHGAGTIATMVGPVSGDNPFGCYLVELAIKTTARGKVNVLMGSAPLIGDHPDGYTFVVGGVATTGIENNRAIDDVTYTFMYETSGTTFSQITVKTDASWAGQITSVKLFAVSPMKFSVGGAATGNGVHNPMGIKVGGYARNDIALGDKFSLAAFYPDDGLPKTPAHNLAIGAKALASCRDGDQNTAVGTYTLQFHQTSNCTAVGYSALKLNTKGRENTAIGYKSLTSNTVGSRNVASGFWALGLLVDGDFNTATGWYAGRNLLSGSSNTYNGARAGLSNAGGVGCTYNGAHAGYGSGALFGPFDYVTCSGSESWAFGVGATTHGVQARVGTLAAASPEGTALGHLSSATGDYAPTAVGYAATASGTRSTACGEEAKAIGAQATATGALAQANGDYTVANGAQAGVGNTGTRNTFIGPSAGAGVNAFSNVSAIGSFSQVTGNNQIQLGDSATTTFAFGAVQNRSDGRDKADIRNTVLGLDFILALRPVDFRWDYRDDYREIDKKGRVTELVKDGSKKRERFHHGFIAQEVAKTASDLGVEFGGHQDHSVNGGKDIQSLGHAELFAPIVRAIQEIAAENRALREEIDILKSQLKA